MSDGAGIAEGLPVDRDELVEGLLEAPPRERELLGVRVAELGDREPGDAIAHGLERDHVPDVARDSRGADRRRSVQDFQASWMGAGMSRLTTRSCVSGCVVSVIMAPLLDAVVAASVSLR